MSQLSLHDFYQQLDEGDRAYAQEQAEEIKQIAHNATIQIGQKLIKVKQRLEHGQFLTWIEGEFEWKEHQARKMITIAAEFSNRDHGLDLPQAIKPAYALASALAKESEEGKEELLDEYQEKLEEKQLATPEHKEPPKSLTEKEIKELVEERDRLKEQYGQLETQYGEVKEQYEQKEIELNQTKANFDEKVNSKVNSTVKEKEQEIKKDLEQKYSDQIAQLEQQVEAKQKSLDKRKSELEKAKEDHDRALKKFKENPDPETKKKIDELKESRKKLQSKVASAQIRLEEAKNKREEQHGLILTAGSFLKAIEAAFTDNPKIYVAIASPYIDEGHVEEFTRLKDAFLTYGELIEESLNKRGLSDSNGFVTVEASLAE